MAARPFVYCFSVDLRLDDHAGIAAAAAHSEVLPVLVIDEALADGYGPPPACRLFLRRGRALAAELQERGSGLIVRRGERGACLRESRRKTTQRAPHGARLRRCRHCGGSRAQERLEERGYVAEIVHDAPAIAPEEIDGARGGSTGYRAFAPYFERWSARPVASYEQPLLLRFSSVTTDEATCRNLRSSVSTLDAWNAVLPRHAHVSTASHAARRSLRDRRFDAE